MKSRKGISTIITILIMIFILAGIALFFILNGVQLGRQGENKIICTAVVDNNVLLGVRFTSYNCLHVGQCGIFETQASITGLLDVTGSVVLESAGRKVSKPYSISVFGGQQTLQLTTCSTVLTGTLTIIDNQNVIRDQRFFTAI